MFGCKRCSLFLLGAGVGAIAGLLLAPKSGREIRQELLGGPLDVIGEPETEIGTALTQEPQSDEDLRARIDETRARLKQEIEARQEND